MPNTHLPITALKIVWSLKKQPKKYCHLSFEKRCNNYPLSNPNRPLSSPKESSAIHMRKSVGLKDSIMVNGPMKNFMEADSSSSKMDPIIRGPFATGLQRVKVATYSIMAAFMKEKFITTKQVEKAPTSILFKTTSIRANGSKMCLTATANKSSPTAPTTRETSPKE